MEKNVANKKALRIVGLLLVFLVPIHLTSFFAIIFPLFREPQPFMPGLAYTFSNWIVFVLFLFLLRKIGIGLKNIGLGKAKMKDLLYAFLFFLIGIAIFSATTPLFDALGLEKMRWMEYSIKSKDEILILLFYAVITAPICEEIFFRGYGITTIGKWTRNPWIAGLICNLAFALMHLPAFGLRGFVQIGLIWALLPMTLFIWRKSLYPGIIMHAMNNALSYIVVPLLLT